MMKIFMKFMIVIWNIMTMRIHLPIMGTLDSTMTIAYGGHELLHHRHRVEPDNLARIKFSVPKFTRPEDPDAYLEWEERCDQIF
jgi:hypothetical protein